MNRPSMQFYPADWRGNAKLRRCSHAARGAWVDILCVLHDSDEYGVCRWPLVDLCHSAGIPISLGRELRDKDVLKGKDSNFPSFTYTTHHAGQETGTHELIAKSDGPCWFSSRMVRDEWMKKRRGATTRFDSEHQPTRSPMATPTRRQGERQGDGPSSSASSSIHKDHKASGKRFTRLQTELTARMHKCLNGQWENDRQKWMGYIKNFTGKAERVIAEVERAIKESDIHTTPAQFAQNTWEKFSNE